MQMDVREEQLLAVERNTVRHADVTYVAARARGGDRLHHRLLGSDTLQHRIGADSVGQLLDARNTFIPSLSDNVGSTKFACELLARRVTAHRDDSLRTQLLRGEHAKQSDRTVTDHHNRGARFNIRSIGGEPPGPHNI